jgi:hypothetical protein
MLRVECVTVQVRLSQSSGGGAEGVLVELVVEVYFVGRRRVMPLLDASAVAPFEGAAIVLCGTELPGLRKMSKAKGQLRKVIVRTSWQQC